MSKRSIFFSVYDQRLETFRFEDKNDYEYLKAFSRILKKIDTLKASLFFLFCFVLFCFVLFSIRKDSTVIYIEGG